MLDEAEQLLLGCGRFDVLDKLYQDSDESKDHNMYYNNAKYMEAVGDLCTAVPM